MRPGELALAWLYTGPLGHLYGAVADLAQLWIAYLASRVRLRLTSNAGLDR